MGRATFRLRSGAHEGPERWQTRMAPAIAKGGGALLALLVLIQVSGLCLCVPAANGCEPQDCCPRSTPAHHRGGAVQGVFASAPGACCMTQAPPAAQARLEDRAPYRAAVFAVAESRPGSDALGLTPTTVTLSLASFSRSSPPTLVLRI